MSYPEVQGKLTLPRIDDTKDGMGINNINPLNADLNPICHLLALLGAHHILHVSRIRVKLLLFTLRRGGGVLCSGHITACFSIPVAAGRVICS